MAGSIKMTYVNHSMISNENSVFIFTKDQSHNEPKCDVLKHNTAWKVIRNVGHGSSFCFEFPLQNTLQASWGECNKTQMYTVKTGQCYQVIKDDTGIVLCHVGKACNDKVIELENKVHVDGGVNASIFKDGQAFITHKRIGYEQKACFTVERPKLYWGTATEIKEGQSLDTAILSSDYFFEQSLEGVSSVQMRLIGNPKEGYQFVVHNDV